jgi:microcystin-dependent protein
MVCSICRAFLETRTIFLSEPEWITGYRPLRTVHLYSRPGKPFRERLMQRCFPAMGATYGVGDGSTTFNLPDKTGRVSAMQEASSTRLTSTYFGGNSTTLGAVGGLESQTLTLAQLPTGITSANASQAISVTSTVGGIPSGASINSAGSAGNPFPQTSTVGTITSAGNNSISVTSNNTSRPLQLS